MADIKPEHLKTLREHILNSTIEEPLLFSKIHKNWVPCSWSLNEWGNIFGSQNLLEMRCGQQVWNESEPQWESKCRKIELTWNELVSWASNQKVIKGEQSITPENNWLFYDYNHFPKTFDESSNLQCRNHFSWAALGFPEKSAESCTFWAGTKGSHTPCHFDTYSCNLVSQVFGRKTWTLFPPKDLNYLHPTRIPYEESSVYSRINFCSQFGIQHYLQDLKNCSPLKITLEPGDCLYVPPKWWHFVQSDDEFTISINTWIELPEDHLIRMQEAILKTLVTSLVGLASPDTTARLLNPNEDEVIGYTESDVEQLLKTAHSQVNFQNHVTQRSSQLNTDSTLKTNKKMRLTSDSISTVDQLLTIYPWIQRLTPYHFEKNKTYSSQEKSLPSQTKSSTYIEHLLNALGHPDVLQSISTQFITNVQNE